MKTAVHDQYSTVLSAISSFHPRSYPDLLDGIMALSEQRFHSTEYAFSPVPIRSLVEDLFIEGLIERLYDSYVLTSSGKVFLFAGNEAHQPKRTASKHNRRKRQSQHKSNASSALAR